jgi:hypothetical protein
LSGTRKRTHSGSDIVIRAASAIQAGNQARRELMAMGISQADAAVIADNVEMAVAARLATTKAQVIDDGAALAIDVRQVKALLCMVAKLGRDGARAELAGFGRHGEPVVRVSR